MATQPRLEIDNTSPMLVPVSVPEVEMPTLNQQVALILTKPPEGDAFYDRVKAKADAFVADVSTKKGRDECIAMAAKVTKTKTLIEASSKELTEEARTFTNSINAARKPMIERLAALAADVRRPVTEWEEAEKARVAECRAIIDGIKADTRIAEEDTWQTVRARGLAIHEMAITTGKFGALFDEALSAKNDAVEALSAAMKRLRAAELAATAAAEEAERNRIELEVLRAKQAERDAADEAARVAEADRLAAVAAAEAEERAIQAERDRLEAERIAAEERAEEARLAELERVRLAEEAAAEAAREQERAAAQAEQERRDAAAQALIDEANERAKRIEEAAAEAQRERDVAEAERVRLALLAEAEQAEAARIEAARVANVRHRTSVKAAIERALMERGADDATAHKIASDMVGGTFPHIEVKF